MILDASAVDSFDGLCNLQSVDFLGSRLSASRAGQHVSFFGHPREAMTPHHVGVVQLLPLQVILDSPHVLTQQSLLDTSLNLWNHTPSVDVEVFAW